MQYGIGHLSIIPVRTIPDHTAEMCTQLLYGDYYKIIEKRKLWSKIRIGFDSCEGWITNNQILNIREDNYREIENKKQHHYVSDLVALIETETNIPIPLVLGSSIECSYLLQHRYQGSFTNNTKEKSNLIETALLYLNAPFLWGGKTPFGLDCSGFTQMVYRISGYKLLRYAHQQATQGEVLSFIEESEAGDLAFFDTSEGKIDHVGILMENNFIIHVHEKVRIDRIDHTGIFNSESGRYTHKLRVIKKIV